MDNRNVLGELWNKYLSSTENTIEARVEAVMDQHVPTLPDKFRGDDREAQYRTFLSDADKAYRRNEDSAKIKGFAASLPACAAGSFAGARVGRLFGPFGALLGAVGGGILAGIKVDEAVTEGSLNRTVRKVMEDYVTVLDRMD